MSDLTAENFRLSLEVKLVDERRQQRHAVPHAAARRLEEMQGYQADIGAGWWGKLYEENGRALLWDKSGERTSRRASGTTTRSRPSAATSARGSTASRASISTIRRATAAASSRCSSTPAGRWKCGSGI